jgi:integrase
MGRKASERLTDRLLERRLPLTGTDTLTDATVHGLYVEGRRDNAVWRVRRQANGKRERLTLGRWPAMGTQEARNVALAALAGPGSTVGFQPGGPGPFVAPEPTGPTIRDLIDGWCKHKAHRRTIEKARQDLTRDLASLLDRDALTLSRPDLLAVLDAKIAKSPTTGRRVAGETKSMLRWAAEREMCNPTLASTIRTPPANRRERTPTLPECRLIWQGAESLPPVWRAYYRLLLLTGMRTGEAAAIEWAWVEGDTLSLPSTATKSKRRFLVPLSEPAQRVIEELRPITGGNRLVFTHGDEKQLGRIHSNRDRLLEATGMEKWNPHDLRRALVSWLAANGCPLPVADRMLNHAASKSVGGVLAHYMHYDYLDERRHWLGRWGKRLSHLSPTP